MPLLLPENLLISFPFAGQRQPFTGGAVVFLGAAFCFVELDEEYREPTHEEIKESIRRGLKEVQLIEEGKMKSTPIDEFLDELEKDGL